MKFVMHILVRINIFKGFSKFDKVRMADFFHLESLIEDRSFPAVIPYDSPTASGINWQVT